MKSNIEIKARIQNLHEVQKRINEYYGSDYTVLNQKDIYYGCNTGRLKLRIFSEDEAELISYRRDNIKGPKKSDYSIYKTNNPGQLNKALESSLGIIGVVEKRRLVYITGQTRIHLDDVAGLGNYLELEVVLKSGQSADEGLVIAESIIKELEVKKEKLIEGSYIDLLLNRNETQKI
ncbi:MAG TPA: class IV adenylate cyclase [Thermodesulfobacteriota bacterium]|nr:class IV adenylate cyclase [Thermodesulfobacteriota bacterium]